MIVCSVTWNIVLWSRDLNLFTAYRYPLTSPSLILSFISQITNCLFSSFWSKCLFLYSEYKSKTRGEQFGFLFVLYQQRTISFKQQVASSFAAGFLSLEKLTFVGGTLRSMWVRLKRRGWQSNAVVVVCESPPGVNDPGMCWRVPYPGHRTGTETRCARSGGRGWVLAIQIQAHSVGSYQIAINYHYLPDCKLLNKLGRKPLRVWECCSCFPVLDSSAS